MSADAATPLRSARSGVGSVDAAAQQCVERLTKLRGGGSPGDILGVLRHAARLTMTVAALQRTHIGKAVNHSGVRRHASKEVREAAAKLVGQWRQLARAGQPAGGGQHGAAGAAAPSTPPAKRTRAASVGSGQKKLRRGEGADAGAAGGGGGKPPVAPTTTSPKPALLTGREYLESRRAAAPKQAGAAAAAAAAAPATGAADGVLDVLAFAAEKAQSAHMRVPISAMTFGPSAPQRRRPGGSKYFCYMYRKNGECENGTNCKYAHCGDGSKP